MFDRLLKIGVAVLVFDTICDVCVMFARKCHDLENRVHVLENRVTVLLAESALTPDTRGQ